MSEWQNLVPASALGPGEVLEVQWQGEDILLYRSWEGECHAITAYCPHMDNYIPNGLAPGQSLGALLEQGELRCPYHGWRFNGRGQCTHIPQGQRVPAKVKQGKPVALSWAVRERGKQIQIAPR